MIYLNTTRQDFLSLIEVEGVVMEFVLHLRLDIAQAIVMLPCVFYWVYVARFACFGSNRINLQFCGYVAILRPEPGRTR